MLNNLVKKFLLLGIIVVSLAACGENVSAPVSNATSSTTPLPAVAITEVPSLLSWQVPILMYHHIGTAPVGADKIRQNLTVSTAAFKRHLALIKAKKYHPITFADMDNYIEHGVALPSKPIMITLDDGYDDNYLNAFPALRDNDMPAVFYIITDKVGGDGYMTWKQVKELKAANEEVGSHTRTHPDLSVISANKQKLKDEIVQAKQILEGQELGPILSLAYPSGKYNAVVAELAGATYKFSRTTHHGIFSETSKSAEIPDIRMTEDSDLDTLLR